MKILFVFPEYSKDQSQAWLTSTLQQKWNDKLFFLFFHNPENPSFQNIKQSISVPEKGGLKNYLKIKDFIKKNNIQAIISSHPSTFLLTGIIARKCKIPHISKLQSSGDIPRRFYFWLLFLLFNDGILTLNNQIKSRIIHKPFIHPQRIKVVYSPVLNLPTLSSSQDQPDPILHLTAIRNLSRRGGLNLLLEAIALLPSELQQKIQLNIVGSGRGERKLRQLVSELNLKQMVFFHPLPQDPSQFLDKTSVYVDLSHLYKRKNAYFAIAMAKGIPVLCANKGLINDIILERKAGFATSLHPQAIANQLTSILTKQPLRKIGTQASQVAQRLFSLEGTLNETCDFISALDSRA